MAIYTLQGETGPLLCSFLDAELRRTEATFTYTQWDSGSTFWDSNSTSWDKRVLGGIRQRSDYQPFYLEFPEVRGSYSRLLIAEETSFSATVNEADGLFSYGLTASNGHIAVSPAVNGLSIARTTYSGTYTHQGQAITLNTHRLLKAESSPVLLAGERIDRVKLTTLMGETGEVSVSLQELRPFHDGFCRSGTEWDNQNTTWDGGITSWDSIEVRCLKPEIAVFALEGQDARLQPGEFLRAEGATFVVDHPAFDFSKNISIDITPQAIELTGQNVGKIQSKLLKAIAASIAIEDQGTELIVNVSFDIQPETGSYNSSMLNVNSHVGKRLSTGGLSLTGQEVGERKSITGLLDAGSLTLQGQNAELEWDLYYEISAETATYSANHPLINWGVGARLSTGSISLSTPESILGWGKRLLAESGQLTIDSEEVPLVQRYISPSDSGSFAIAGQSAYRNIRWRVTDSELLFQTLWDEQNTLWDGGSTDWDFADVNGQIDITGVDLPTIIGRRRETEAGEFQISVEGTRLSRKYIFRPNTALFYYRGSDADRLDAKGIAPVSVEFKLQPQEIKLTYKRKGASVEPQSIVLTGNASFRKFFGYSEIGSYHVDTHAVDDNYHYRFNPAPASYSVDPVCASFVSADNAVFKVEAYPAKITVVDYSRLTRLVAESAEILVEEATDDDHHCGCYCPAEEEAKGDISLSVDSANFLYSGEAAALTSFNYTHYSMSLGYTEYLVELQELDDVSCSTVETQSNTDWDNGLTIWDSGDTTWDDSYFHSIHPDLDYVKVVTVNSRAKRGWNFKVGTGVVEVTPEDTPLDFKPRDWRVLYATKGEFTAEIQGLDPRQDITVTPSTSTDWDNGLTIWDSGNTTWDTSELSYIFAPDLGRAKIQGQEAYLSVDLRMVSLQSEFILEGQDAITVSTANNLIGDTGVYSVESVGVEGYTEAAPDWFVPDISEPPESEPNAWALTGSFEVTPNPRGVYGEIYDSSEGRYDGVRPLADQYYLKPEAAHYTLRGNQNSYYGENDLKRYGEFVVTGGVVRGEVFQNGRWDAINPGRSDGGSFVIQGNTIQPYNEPSCPPVIPSNIIVLPISTGRFDYETGLVDYNSDQTMKSNCK
jgi:hypothetical protein